MTALPLVVVGAGPVGMALALGLHRAGIACRLFDARSREARRGDRRVLALSHGSRQTLERLGVWAALAATPIRRIHVSHQGGFGRTVIRAEDYEFDALGHCVGAARLAAALDDALSAAGVAIEEGMEVANVATSAQDAIVSCNRQGRAETLRTALVAFAEGAVTTNDEVVARDYEQHAVVCEVHPVQPAAACAYERFTAHGPVALLPHGDGFSLVFVTRPEEAKRIAALSDADFLANLEREFGERLRFDRASPRAVFPLALRYRRRPAGARTVYLGNSAQTLHPVAGQGFNLALRDVWALLQQIAADPSGDPGRSDAIERYARARRLDRGGAIGFTDGLIRVFSNDDVLLRGLRGGGLLLLDLLPAARHFLARRMMFGARAWP